jgi:integrase
MATIQFKALGKKSPVNLNLRFFHNKINCYAKSNIFINLNDWNTKTNKVKPSANVKIKDSVNEKIKNMSEFIIEQFVLDFNLGNQIDTNWLIKSVNQFYNKPTGDNDYNHYFTPFISKYIEESKTRINLKTGKKIATKTIANYKMTLSKIENYENKIGRKFRIEEINLNFHERFTSSLKLDENLANTSIEKFISQIKSFIKESKLRGCKTSTEIESKKFTFKKDETIDTFLNIDEINLLFNFDLSNNPSYDKVRNLLIIGVWTGLRISDLKRINEFDKTTNRIKIISTEKTNSSVEIPIHPQVKIILEKCNYILPSINEQKFNIQVKEICKLVGINDEILGYIKDPVTNRKVKDIYPKWKLISSHTCRRSFVSNHYGKLDDKTIMAITTHKSHSQFMDYVKTSSIQHAQNLENYWKENQ